MLKITTLNGKKEQRLIVEGKLVESGVSELELAWNQARQHGHSRHTVVDLSGVIRIDPRGEAALMAMIAEGASIVFMVATLASGTISPCWLRTLTCLRSGALLRNLASI